MLVSSGHAAIISSEKGWISFQPSVIELLMHQYYDYLQQVVGPLWTRKQETQQFIVTAGTNF